MNRLRIFIVIALVVIIGAIAPAQRTQAATYAINLTDWTETFPGRLHPSSTVYIYFSAEIVVGDRPDGTTPTLIVSGTLPSGLKFPVANGSNIGAGWYDLGGDSNWLFPPTHACTWDSDGRNFQCVGKWTLDSTHPQVQIFAHAVMPSQNCSQPPNPNEYITDGITFRVYKQSDMSLKATASAIEHWYCA